MNTEQCGKCWEGHHDYQPFIDPKSGGVVRCRDCGKKLGWASYVLTCAGCQLEIGDPDPDHGAEMARAFGWRMIEVPAADGVLLRRTLCATCAAASPESKPFPTAEEIRKMEGR
jgi:hypothetical protein